MVRVSRDIIATTGKPSDCLQKLCADYGVRPIEAAGGRDTLRDPAKLGD